MAVKTNSKVKIGRTANEKILRIINQQNLILRNKVLQNNAKLVMKLDENVHKNAEKRRANKEIFVTTRNYKQFSHK